jgi:hypothetical protein
MCNVLGNEITGIILRIARMSGDKKVIAKATNLKHELHE